MDDVDVTAALQLEHDLQIGVVLAQPHGWRHRHVLARSGTQVEGTGQHLADAQVGVAARPREDRDPDTAVAQPTAQVPRQGLEAPGEGFLQGKARGGDHHDVHTALPASTPA